MWVRGHAEKLMCAMQSFANEEREFSSVALLCVPKKTLTLPTDAGLRIDSQASRAYEPLWLANRYEARLKELGQQHGADPLGDSEPDGPEAEAFRLAIACEVRPLQLHRADVHSCRACGRAAAVHCRRS